MDGVTRRVSVVRGGGRAAATVLLAVAAVLMTAPSFAAGSDAAPRYYVAIGASETLGFQGTGPGGATRVTHQGYTDDLVNAERARWPGLQLVLFACPGLRMDVALDGGRPTTLPASLRHVVPSTTTGRCRRTAGSEVEAAAAFIASHRGQVELVTLDLGYPDVAECLLGKAVDAACVTDALGRIRAGLPAVVSRLRTAGGSSLRIVGLSHADPFLAYYLGESVPDPTFSEATAA
ncbi:MAG: hypothetical protein ACRDXC_09910, partial [Acidimicrobiales bacterium]